MNKRHPDKYAVDDNDTIVGIMPIEEIIEKGLNRRASRVFVFNESGSVLITKRSKNVMKPLKFDPSMGGHVEVGESYLEAAKRELKEELGLGISDTELVEVTKPYLGDGFISALYKVTIPDNAPIGFDHEEVDSVYWMTPNEVDELVSTKKEECTKSLVNSWRMFRDKLISI
jgi:isopentenyldiphosphate isomerase